MSGTSSQGSGLLWEASVMCGEIIPASRMFQFEWMDHSTEKRNSSFAPDFKWGCSCSHVEVETYSWICPSSLSRSRKDLRAKIIFLKLSS